MDLAIISSVNFDKLKLNIPVYLCIQGTDITVVTFHFDFFFDGLKCMC